MNKPTIAILIAVAFGAVASELAAARDTPNLIWIMADDLGYGELGCYGQTVIKTPRLDCMAGEGMRSRSSTPAPRYAHHRAAC